jgi:hypothetical protein
LALNNLATSPEGSGRIDAGLIVIRAATLIQRPRRPPNEALVMPVFKLFAESTKEHQVGSIFCAACNPGANYHRKCPLGSGIIHHETFTEKSSVSPDYVVTWRDATGVLETVQEPAGVMPNAVSLTGCDKCGARTRRGREDDNEL